MKGLMAVIGITLMVIPTVFLGVFYENRYGFDWYFTLGIASWVLGLLITIDEITRINEPTEVKKHGR